MQLLILMINILSLVLLQRNIRQRKIKTNGDEIRQAVAVLVPVAAVRGDPQDGIGLASGLMDLQLHVVGQVSDCYDLQHRCILLLSFHVGWIVV